MYREEDTKTFKALIGQFYDEVKGNTITELMVWLDCKIEYTNKMNKEQMRSVRKGRY